MWSSNNGRMEEWRGSGQRIDGIEAAGAADELDDHRDDGTEHENESTQHHKDGPIGCHDGDLAILTDAGGTGDGEG